MLTVTQARHRPLMAEPKLGFLPPVRRTAAVLVK
jgi:hypothetical protein